MTHYLGNKNRIKTSKEFQQVFKKGERITEANIVVNFLERGDELPARMGIVVTKKIGNACQRNRLKRLIRECFRSNLPHIKRGYDIIIVFRKPARDISYRALRERFELLLRDAGLLYEGCGSQVETSR